MPRTGKVVIVAVALFLIAGSGEAQAAVLLNQPLAAGDPNRDPNWEWWHVGKLYTLHVAGLDPAPRT